MPEDLVRRLEPRVKRLGYLGEFFKVAANQPRVLAAFMELTDALKEALPDRLTETVALTVSTAAKNPYERHQHERLSEKLGYSRDWILEVMSLKMPGRHMTPAETAVQRFTLKAIETKGLGCAPEFEAVVEAVGPGQATAVLLLAGRYLTHAIFVNSLELAPPVGSIFTDGGNG